MEVYKKQNIKKFINPQPKKKNSIFHILYKFTTQITITAGKKPTTSKIAQKENPKT